MLKLGSSRPARPTTNKFQINFNQTSLKDSQGFVLWGSSIFNKDLLCLGLHQVQELCITTLLKWLT